jgi:hypothetical protein
MTDSVSPKIYSFSQPTLSTKPHTWSLHGPKGMLVSIDLNTGEYRFGENYIPNEAAKLFWEAVGLHVRNERGKSRD